MRWEISIFSTKKLLSTQKMFAHLKSGKNLTMNDVDQRITKISKRWLNVFVMKIWSKARVAQGSLLLPDFARVCGKFCSTNSSTTAT
jgi:hypothetical protein